MKLSNKLYLLLLFSINLTYITMSLSLLQLLLRLGALLLIMFVLVTNLIFACFRVMNRGRFIHMNEEVALLAANICLLFRFHDPGMHD